MDTKSESLSSSLPVGEYDLENDPRDEGCFCQRCKGRYKVDFNLPDDLWERIRGLDNLLCGSCIAQRIELIGEFDYFDVVKLDAAAPPDLAQLAREIAEKIEPELELHPPLSKSRRAKIASIIQQSLAEQFQETNQVKMGTNPATRLG